MFKITKKKLYISAIIVIIAIIFNKQILEGFRMGRRYFWAFTPPSRNSSYDIRGDKDVRTKYNPKNVGVFYESAIYPNFSQTLG
jgi:hypothetical protein